MTIYKVCHRIQRQNLSVKVYVSLNGRNVIRASVRKCSQLVEKLCKTTYTSCSPNDYLRCDVVVFFSVRSIEMETQASSFYVPLMLLLSFVCVLAVAVDFQMTKIAKTQTQIGQRVVRF